MLRRNLVALNVYIRKEESSKNNALKKLEKGQIKPKVSGSTEIITIRNQRNRKKINSNTTILKPRNGSLKIIQKLVNLY